VYQYVEVPFVARICPAVPVALLESRNSPVRVSLAIVVDARLVRPVATRFPVVVLLTAVSPVKLPFVAEKLVV
jgi:hypothetical protein